MVAVLDSLGYRASVHIVAGTGSYYATLVKAAPRIQAGWVAWVQDYASAADFLEPLFGCPPVVAAGQSVNYSRYCAPALERQIQLAAGRQITDPVASQLAWAAADRLTVDSAAAVPYANPLAVTLTSRRTGDYPVQPGVGSAPRSVLGARLTAAGS
jgi:ABC-type oligopeptide transport system substrate-binding subunit